MRMNTVDDCRLLALPQISRIEGSITPVQARDTVPFDIARVFYIYDVVGGAARGAHAHYELEQVLVCVMGSFRVGVDDGVRQRVFELNRPYTGLYVPSQIWAQEVDFSGGAICVVLASMPYHEPDYIRSYEDFLAYRGVQPSAARSADATASTADSESSG